MYRDRRKAGRAVSFLFKMMPLLLLCLISLLVGRLFGKVTVEDLLSYTPESYAMAALVIIGLYAVKSLSVFFPLMVLYIAVGSIFPPVWAVLLNIAGLMVCISIPYGLGRLVGKEYMDALLKKYKKARELNHLRQGSEWFFCYILRVVNLLPGDIVSLLLGSMGADYKKYVAGSLTGLAPTMVAATFMGVNIMDPASPAFIASCALTILISVVSVVVYHRMTARAKG